MLIFMASLNSLANTILQNIIKILVLDILVLVGIVVPIYSYPATKSSAYGCTYFAEIGPYPCQGRELGRQGNYNI